MLKEVMENCWIIGGRLGDYTGIVLKVKPDGPDEGSGDGADDYWKVIEFDRPTGIKGALNRTYGQEIGGPATREQDFGSEAEVEEYLVGKYGADTSFKRVVKRNISSATRQLGDVNGFPCNVERPVPDMEMAGETGYPVFRKSPGQASLFAAGYYVYGGEGKDGVVRWKKGYCPQLRTLNSALEVGGQVIGPFKTDTEQGAEWSARNKQAKLQEKQSESGETSQETGETGSEIEEI